MVAGRKFDKMTKGKTKNSEVRLDPSAHLLCVGLDKIVDVTKVIEVRTGFSTQEFLSHGVQHKLDEKCALSIVYYR